MKKIVSAHQPAFIPWAGLIHKLMLCDEFIVMDLAKFRKREFMHRNSIQINNQKNSIGLKVSNQNEHSTCNKVVISEHHKKNLEEIKNKIVHTYKKYEFFKDLDEFLEDCFSISDTDLNSICLKQLSFFKLKFNIKTIITNESSILSIDEINKFKNASERLLEHALRSKSYIYITGVNSLAYLDKSLFKTNNIYNHVQNFSYTPFLKYQNTQEPLSIIHQIASIGFDETRDIILKTQETKEILFNIYDRS